MTLHPLPKIIQTHLKKNKLDHAYLFYGPGKKIRKALQFARIILACREKKLSLKSDFIMLEKEEEATQIKIERIREMIKRVSLRSQGKRVILLKKAELLSLEAANALLKILEEPPPGTIFILTASNIKQVIPTIVSRCQGYYLADDKPKIKILGREKRIKDFLAGDLVARFKFAEEVAKIKGQAVLILNGLARFLRSKMMEKSDLSIKKRLAREIRQVLKSRLLLKRNISARLILEDLSLRLKRRKI